MVSDYYLRRLRGEDVPEVYTFRIIDKNGDIKWIEIHVVAIGWEGKPATLSFLSDVTEREKALAKVKTLSGLLPMCAWCKNIRNDKGYWQTVEEYIGEHSKAEFTHGICLDCMKREFPEAYEQEVNDKN